MEVQILRCSRTHTYDLVIKACFNELFFGALCESIFFIRSNSPEA